MDGEAESTSLFGNREAIEKSRWIVGVEVIGTVFYSLTHVGIIVYAAVMRILVIYARPVRVVPSWPIRAHQIESVSLATSHALLSKLPKRKVSLLFSSSSTLFVLLFPLLLLCTSPNFPIWHSTLFTRGGRGGHLSPSRPQCLSGLYRLFRIRLPRTGIGVLLRRP